MFGRVAILYLVRHGESEANVERVFDGRERPLTALGRRQAAAAAAWLSARPVDVIFASPYRRAHETAAVIAERVGRPVEPALELEEVKVGELAGRSDQDAHRVFQAVYSRWLAGDVDARFPGGETLAEACHRFQRFMSRIATRYPGRSVVGVGHGGMPEAVLPRLLQLPEGVTRRVGLAAITTLRLGSDGTWVAEAASWGQVGHLAGVEAQP